MQGYDGTVRIDTSLEDKNFNDGIKKIGSSVGKVVTKFVALQKILAVIKFAIIGITVALAVVFMLVVGKILAIGRSLIAAGKRLQEMSKQFNSALSSVGKLREHIEGFDDSFESLKQSIANAFRPLLIAVLPVLINIANWLTIIFNKVASLLALIFKQKSVMMGVATATGGVAKNMQDAEKAAKGALASFDELNVLDMQDEDEGGGGAAGGGISLTEMPIDEGVKGWFEELKETLTPLWEELVKLWEALKKLADTVWRLVLTPIMEALGINMEDINLVDLATIAVKWLTKQITKLTDWILDHPDEIQNWISALVSGGPALIGLALVVLLLTASLSPLIILLGSVLILIILLAIKWDALKVTIKQLSVILAIKTQEVLTNAETTLKRIWFIIKFYINKALDWIKEQWDKFIAWVTEELWPGIQTGFEDGLKGVQEFWQTTFDKLLEITTGIMNSIISIINSGLTSIGSGLNNAIAAINLLEIHIPVSLLFPEGLDFSPNISSITMPQIPELASGAVIPPNASFLAVLGDQTSGRNIEAPEELIRQIVREEAGNNSQEITIRFEGSLGALIRTLKPYIDKENKRVGGSLIAGGNV